MNNITLHIDKFVEGCQKLCQDSHTEHGFTFPVDVLTVEPGRKYAKIVRATLGGTGKSVHCFVDMTNGNVLKAAGWKAPVTKNPRSNVFDADFGVSGMTAYGAKYIKG